MQVNRICFHDDAFGVGEALMEEAFNQSLVARGSHYLIFGPLNSTAGNNQKFPRSIMQVPEFYDFRKKHCCSRTGHCSKKTIILLDILIGSK